MNAESRDQEGWWSVIHSLPLQQTHPSHSLALGSLMFHQGGQGESKQFGAGTSDIKTSFASTLNEWHVLSAGDFVVERVVMPSPWLSLDVKENEHIYKQWQFPLLSRRRPADGIELRFEMCEQL